MASHRVRPGLALVVGVCLLTLAACGNPWGSFERKTLNPGVRSHATPADVGLSFERLSIPSGPRRLDAFLVRADLACPRTAAVLIFHGRGETIADWIKVQRRLHENCISSLVFDYSGHGRSSPPGTIDNLNADALVAYWAFVRAFPGQRRCLLSHSLGGGPMLFAGSRPGVAPDCVVVASPFSSLRAIAEQGGLPRWLAFFMPDAWNNVEAAAHLKPPMLWLHSRSDATIPLALGEAVYDAKTGAKRKLVLNGFNHNAIYATLPQQIWDPVVEFILGGNSAN